MNKSLMMYQIFITPSLNPPDVLATVYTQVKLPPLVPPWKGGKQENLVPSPFQGEG
jgi:hypothetical protein